MIVQGNGAGKADTGSLTLSYQAQQAGVLNVYLGGVRVRVTVEKGQHGKAVGDALASAINALPSLPVNAVSAAPGGENVTADQTVVTLTARFISEYSAQDIRLNYYDGEITPARAGSDNCRAGGIPGITISSCPGSIPPT